MNTIFISKYITILKTFNEAEVKAFELWLQSPWCNSNKNLIRLFQKIKKYYPLFNDEKLTKEKLFKQILPTGKFSDRRMNNLLSEGYLAAEKFLIYQHLSHQENLQKDILTKELQSRHLEDWFFRDTEKEIARLEDKAVKDWEDHLGLLRLHRRIYHHPNQNPRMKPGGLTIIKMGEELDLVYLLEKAAIINEKKFRSRILKNENHNIEVELKKWKVVTEGIKHPALDFYKRRFAYTEENMVEEYFKLRSDFFKRFEELNEKEQKVHLMSLMNDAFFLRKKTLLELSEIFPLFQFGFENNLLHQSGRITRVTFTTAIVVSNTLMKFDFSEKIINDFSKYLNKEIQLDAINWAIAHTSSKRKKFKECLETLILNEFNTSYFKKIIKVLTLQTYFELFLIAPDSYEFYLLSYCSSFEKWIQREKSLSKFNKESYTRFIQKCKTLIHIYSDVNFQKDKLDNLFLNEKNIEAMNWLYEKQNQIRKIRGKAAN